MTYPSEPNPYGDAGQPSFPSQPPVEKKNTLGILAVVFAALFDVCAIGLILGIVAVATAKGNEQQKKFGWIAIGIAIAWAVIWAILSFSGIIDFQGSFSTTAP